MCKYPTFRYKSLLPLSGTVLIYIIIEENGEWTKRRLKTYWDFTKDLHQAVDQLRFFSHEKTTGSSTKQGLTTDRCLIWPWSSQTDEHNR